MSSHPVDENELPRYPAPDVEPIRTILVRRLTIAAALAALLLGLSSTLYGVYLIRSTQLDNKSTITSAARAAAAAERGTDRIEDCTTPGRECYDDGQKRAGQFISGINAATLRVIVAALSCQEDGVAGEKALAQCTVRRAKPHG